MNRSKYSDEQIAEALRQVDAGSDVSDVCRQLGISEATLYAWKHRYASLAAHAIGEIRQLREENAQLKRRVADLSLDKDIPAELVRKKA